MAAKKGVKVDITVVPHIEIDEGSLNAAAKKLGSLSEKKLKALTSVDSAGVETLKQIVEQLTTLQKLQSGSKIDGADKQSQHYKDLEKSIDKVTTQSQILLTSLKNLMEMDGHDLTKVFATLGTSNDKLNAELGFTISRFNKVAEEASKGAVKTANVQQDAIKDVAQATLKANAKAEEAARKKAEKVIKVEKDITAVVKEETEKRERIQRVKKQPAAATPKASNSDIMALRDQQKTVLEAMKKAMGKNKLDAMPSEFQDSYKTLGAEVQRLDGLLGDLGEAEREVKVETKATTASIVDETQAINANTKAVEKNVAAKKRLTPEERHAKLYGKEQLYTKTYDETKKSLLRGRKLAQDDLAKIAPIPQGSQTVGSAPGEILTAAQRQEQKRLQKNIQKYTDDLHDLETVADRQYQFKLSDKSKEERSAMKAARVGETEADTKATKANTKAHVENDAVVGKPHRNTKARSGERVVVDPDTHQPLIAPKSNEASKINVPHTVDVTKGMPATGQRTQQQAIEPRVDKNGNTYYVNTATGRRVSRKTYDHTMGGVVSAATDHPAHYDMTKSGTAADDRIKQGEQLGAAVKKQRVGRDKDVVKAQAAFVRKLDERKQGDLFTSVEAEAAFEALQQRARDTGMNEDEVKEFLKTGKLKKVHGGIGQPGYSLAQASHKGFFEKYSAFEDEKGNLVSGQYSTERKSRAQILDEVAQEGGFLDAEELLNMAKKQGVSLRMRSQRRQMKTTHSVKTDDIDDPDVVLGKNKQKRKKRTTLEGYYLLSARAQRNARKLMQEAEEAGIDIEDVLGSGRHIQHFNPEKLNELRNKARDQKLLKPSSGALKWALEQEKATTPPEYYAALQEQRADYQRQVEGNRALGIDKPAVLAPLPPHLANRGRNAYVYAEDRAPVGIDGQAGYKKIDPGIDALADQDKAHQALKAAGMTPAPPENLKRVGGRHTAAVGTDITNTTPEIDEELEKAKQRVRDLADYLATMKKDLEGADLEEIRKLPDYVDLLEEEFAKFSKILGDVVADFRKKHGNSLDQIDLSKDWRAQMGVTPLGLEERLSKDPTKYREITDFLAGSSKYGIKRGETDRNKRYAGAKEMINAVERQFPQHQDLFAGIDFENGEIDETDRKYRTARIAAQKAIKRDRDVLAGKEPFIEKTPRQKSAAADEGVKAARQAAASREVKEAVEDETKAHLHKNTALLAEIQAREGETKATTKSAKASGDMSKKLKIEAAIWDSLKGNVTEYERELGDLQIQHKHLMEQINAVDPSARGSKQKIYKLAEQIANNQEGQKRLKAQKSAQDESDKLEALKQQHGSGAMYLMNSKNYRAAQAELDAAKARDTKRAGGVLGFFAGGMHQKIFGAEVRTPWGLRDRKDMKLKELEVQRATLKLQEKESQTLLRHNKLIKGSAEEADQYRAAIARAHAEWVKVDAEIVEAKKHMPHGGGTSGKDGGIIPRASISGRAGVFGGFFKVGGIAGEIMSRGAVAWNMASGLFRFMSEGIRNLKFFAMDFWNFSKGIFTGLGNTLFDGARLASIRAGLTALVGSLDNLPTGALEASKGMLTLHDTMRLLTSAISAGVSKEDAAEAMDLISTMVIARGDADPAAKIETFYDAFIRGGGRGLQELGISLKDVPQEDGKKGSVGTAKARQFYLEKLRQKVAEVGDFSGSTIATLSQLINVFKNFVNVVKEAISMNRSLVVALGRILQAFREVFNLLDMNALSIMNFGSALMNLAIAALEGANLLMNAAKGMMMFFRTLFSEQNLIKADEARNAAGGPGTIAGEAAYIKTMFSGAMSATTEYYSATADHAAQVEIDSRKKEWDEKKAALDAVPSTIRDPNAIAALGDRPMNNEDRYRQNRATVATIAQDVSDLQKLRYKDPSTWDAKEIALAKANGIDYGVLAVKSTYETGLPAEATDGSANDPHYSRITGPNEEVPERVDANWTLGGVPGVLTSQDRIEGITTPDVVHNPPEDNGWGWQSTSNWQDSIDSSITAKTNALKEWEKTAPGITSGISTLSREDVQKIYDETGEIKGVGQLNIDEAEISNPLAGYVSAEDRLKAIEGTEGNTAELNRQLDAAMETNEQMIARLKVESAMIDTVNTSVSRNGSKGFNELNELAGKVKYDSKNLTDEDREVLSKNKISEAEFDKALSVNWFGKAPSGGGADDPNADDESGGDSTTQQNVLQLKLQLIQRERERTSDYVKYMILVEREYALKKEQIEIDSKSKNSSAKEKALLLQMLELETAEMRQQALIATSRLHTERVLQGVEKSRLAVRAIQIVQAREEMAIQNTINDLQRQQSLVGEQLLQHYAYALQALEATEAMEQARIPALEDRLDAEQETSEIKLNHWTLAQEALKQAQAALALDEDNVELQAQKQKAFEEANAAETEFLDAKDAELQTATDINQIEQSSLDIAIKKLDVQKSQQAMLMEQLKREQHLANTYRENAQKLAMYNIDQSSAAGATHKSLHEVRTAQEESRDLEKQYRQAMGDFDEQIKTIDGNDTLTEPMKMAAKAGVEKDRELYTKDYYAALNSLGTEAVLSLRTANEEILKEVNRFGINFQEGIKGALESAIDALVESEDSGDLKKAMQSVWKKFVQGIAKNFLTEMLMGRPTGQTDQYHNPVMGGGALSGLLGFFSGAAPQGAGAGMNFGGGMGAGAVMNPLAMLFGSPGRGGITNSSQGGGLEGIGNLIGSAMGGGNGFGGGAMVAQTGAGGGGMSGLMGMAMGSLMGGGTFGVGGAPGGAALTQAGGVSDFIGGSLGAGSAAGGTSALASAMPWIAGAFTAYSLISGALKEPKVKIDPDQIFKTYETNWPEFLKRGPELLPLNLFFQPGHGRTKHPTRAGQTVLQNNGTIIGGSAAQVEAALSSIVAQAVRKELEFGYT